MNYSNYFYGIRHEFYIKICVQSMKNTNFFFWKKRVLFDFPGYGGYLLDIKKRTKPAWGFDFHPQRGFSFKCISIVSVCCSCEIEKGTFTNGSPAVPGIVGVRRLQMQLQRLQTTGILSTPVKTLLSSCWRWVNRVWSAIANLNFGSLCMYQFNSIGAQLAGPTKILIICIWVTFNL